MGKIVFVGHSVVKGTDYGGVTRATTFGYKVGIAAGYADADIYVRGVGSETSAGLLARIQTDVVNLAPDVCAAMIGANDWSQGVSIATFTANLRAIAKAITNAGIKLVLYTDNMNRGSVSDFISLGNYQDVTRMVAQENNAPVVDLFSRMCFKAMCNDYVQYFAGTSEKIHLSIAGHAWVAQISGECSPKNIFVKTVDTTPPVTVTPSAPTLSDLSLAVADYLIGGQTPALLTTVGTIRAKL
jgi:hypothetical protein